MGEAGEMSSMLFKLVRAIFLVGVAVGIVFVVGMRAKVAPVQTAVRRVNRAVWNPRQMASAGRPGAYASIVRHVGRSSGTAYETPVVAFPTDDGFAIALPYGRSADWMKNVLAAGSATIVHDGETHQVDRPEIVPAAEVAAHIPANEQRTNQIFNITEALQVHAVPAT